MVEVKELWKLDPTTSYIVLDFEATCWENNDNHEIIEWPMALLNLSESKIQREFRTFICPDERVLSDFCRNLTGITQEQVDNGVFFPVALDAALEWMNDIPRPIMFLTCGNWDLKTMLPKDLLQWSKYLAPDAIENAKVFNNWKNIKDLFKARFPLYLGATDIPSMCAHLGIEMIGRLHSGMDDTRNLARIVLELQK